MSLKQKIVSDFKQAFKDKNLVKKAVLSFLQSEIKNREIELLVKEEGLKDEEVIALIAKGIKQRKDSVESFKKGGREDLAAQEEAEIKVLEEYMPEQMSDDEIEAEVKKVITETGAAGPGDMGKVMGAAMGKMKGKADGSKVKEAVEKLLKG